MTELKTPRTDIFFDFEFIDDGREIVPISVGMCAYDQRVRQTDDEVVSGHLKPGDGVQRSLYIEYSFDPARCNDWVRENVWPHLKSTLAVSSMLGDGYERYGAAIQIREWVAQVCGDTQPRFWGYMPAYDWVCLAQHYGALTQKPEGWPFGVRCLEQWAEMLDVPRDRFPKQEGDVHNALDDAKWNRDLHTFLNSVQAGQKVRRDGGFGT